MRDSVSVCLCVSEAEFDFLCVAQGGERVASVKRQLGKLFEVSIRTAVPDVNVEPVVVPSIEKSGKKFGDYQWCVIGFKL